MNTTFSWSAFWTFVLVCLLAGCVRPAFALNACDRSPILVRNAQIWTPEGLKPVRDVLFRDGYVDAVRPAGSIRPTPATRILNGTGQTLLPGLVDMHLHFGVPGGLPEEEAATPSTYWNITGRQLLRSGVTSGRVHLMSIAAAVQIRNAAAAPCSPLPRLQTAGPGMAGGTQADTPNYVGVRSAEDAAAKVQRVADAGLGWIAIDNAEKFGAGELQALTSAAGARGIRLMGGSDRAEEMDAVLDAGVDTIDISIFDVYSDSLQARLQRHPNLTVVPTVGYHYRLHAFDLDPRLLQVRSNFEFLTASEKSFVAANATKAMVDDAFVVNSRRAYSGLSDRFRALLGLGVPMAVGTDVGSAAQFHTGAIWWELNAWTAFGASARTALNAATAVAAHALRDEHVGTLREGAYADFILYAGNVEHGAFDLARVRAVAKDGVLFVRDGHWIGDLPKH